MNLHMIKPILPLAYVFVLVILTAPLSAQTERPPRPNVRSVQVAPAIDHHQHAFSPAYAALQSPGFKVVTAKDIIELLDAAGIRRAVLLSTAYRWGRPGAEPPHEYAGVKAENDWTGAEAALFPKRLIAFCSFNPLKDYALEELVRCSKDPNLRRGIKLHFGNSDVQLENAEHFEKLKKVFQAANRERTAIVVHMRASISKQRPYGPEQARLFLDLLSFAPDIPVQIAHLAGSGPGFVDSSDHSVIEVLADAVAKKDRRTRRLWFDFATIAHPANPPEIAELIIKLIRQIGPKKILYGSDGATATNPSPLKWWDAFRNVQLTEEEMKTIARNAAPYFP